MLLAAGANADVPRNDGATPLWIASQMGHDHIVKLLLQNGANVDAVRNDGATPLFKASHKGHHAVVHELLKYRPRLGILPVKFIKSHIEPLLYNHVFPLQLEWRDSASCCSFIRASSYRQAINRSWIRSRNKEPRWSYLYPSRKATEIYLRCRVSTRERERNQFALQGNCSTAQTTHE